MRYDVAMSIEQLKSFVTVAEEGGIVRAARRLHLSQPPLTRRIQDLEYELGTSLFTRGPRGVSLTPAGEALLPRARQILDLVEDARQVALHPAQPQPQPASGITICHLATPTSSRSAPDDPTGE